MRSVPLQLVTASFLAALIVLAMLPASAQAAIPKPSVPTFTAKLVDNSYDVEASSTVNPYNGQTVNQPAYHVKNYTLTLTIKNQPFKPITVQEDNATWIVDFYYNIRVKGHYENEWMPIYHVDSGYMKASNTTYTIVTYSTRGNNGFDIPIGSNPGDKADVQVQALIGYGHRVLNASETVQYLMFPWVFTGETSDWSSTQTVTIPTSASVSPTQSIPTINTGSVAPTFWGLTFGETIIIAILCAIAVLLILLVVIWRKNPPNRPPK